MRINPRIVGLGLLLGVGSLFSQNETDAARMSATSLSGTARGLGMAGAFSAAGGDFTGVTLNPAGAALYRRSDIMVTPSLMFTNNRSKYLGESEDQLKSRFQVSNFGLVIQSEYEPYSQYGRSLEKGPKLKSYAFSVGYTQLENYYRETSTSGFNTDNSFSGYLAARATGTSPSMFSDETVQGMGYNSWLIDPVPGDSLRYRSAADNYVSQSVFRIETGRVNEWTFGASGNFGDRIYAGFTLGVRDLDYSSKFTFEESDPYKIHGTQWGVYNSSAGDSIGFNSLRFQENFSTSGSGYNFSFGLIARATDFLRVGLAVQSPTFYSLKDEYNSSLQHISDAGTAYNRSSPSGSFSYRFTTPTRLTAGVSLILLKSLLINIDGQMLDYTTANLSSNSYSFKNENQQIEKSFKRSYNLKAGAEYKYGPVYFRGGLGFLGNVYGSDGELWKDATQTGDKRIQGWRRIATAGMGYREESFYIDIAMVNQKQEDKFTPYDASSGLSPVVVNTTSKMGYYLTFGLRF
jgi:hypothetical protein